MKQPLSWMGAGLAAAGVLAMTLAAASAQQPHELPPGALPPYMLHSSGRTVPVVFDSELPQPTSPLAYRGPGTEHAFGPDARILPDYCYPGSLSPLASCDDLPGTWQGPPPANHGPHLWDDVHTSERMWVAINYLSLWSSGSWVGPLATTSPPGTGQNVAGVLPGADVLLGNTRLVNDQRDAGELRLGWWLIDGQFLGIEAHYWGTEEITNTFSASSTFVNGQGGTILARPFINAQSGQQDAALLAFPNFQRGNIFFDLNGSLDVAATSQLQSAGLTGRHILLADFERNLRWDLIGGYRFLQVDERLRFRDATSDPGGGLVGPTTIESVDQFSTQNDFHLGELGVVLEAHRGRWTLDLTAKCGVGANHQRVRIQGDTTTTSLGTSTITPGGLFTQPTNIGTYRRDKLAVVPEGHARLGYELGRGWELFGGYRLLWISEVLRPSDQIDSAVNVSQIGGQLTGPVRPTHSFLSSEMFVHGLDFGVEWRR